jgi:hypothetical protein
MDEEAIRRRAHEIWEREGRPEGKQAEHWERARAELDAEGAGGGGTGGGAGEADRVEAGGRGAERQAPGRDEGQGGGA